MIKNQNEFMKNISANNDGIFYWDYLKPAFGDSNVDLTDIDAVVEKNGWILMIETKSYGKSVSNGQSTLYYNLHRRCGITVIYLIYAGEEKTGEIESIEIKENNFFKPAYLLFPKEEGFDGEKWLLKYVSNWYQIALKSNFYDIYEIRKKE